MATPTLPCANFSPDGTSCQNAGKSGCANCRLVVYCSSECQKAHWPFHKVHCKSPMNSENWKPEWVVQKRTPSFASNEQVPSYVPFGGDSWLWGGVPALDFLKLDANEGESYKGKLSLLFAGIHSSCCGVLAAPRDQRLILTASGDIRNVVKTITQLPPGWDQPIDITMNDIDIAVVARNAILLLTSLTADDKNEATDCIIHIWYSSFIRKSDHAILEQRIRPLIQTVCDKIKEKPNNRILGKTWTFRKHSLRLVLTKAAWDKVLSYTTVPEGLTMERANQIRKAVTLAESQLDFLERHTLFAIPSHRVPKQRFREEGVLQPFGAQRSEFSIPNPLHSTGQCRVVRIHATDGLRKTSRKLTMDRRLQTSMANSSPIFVRKLEFHKFPEYLKVGIKDQNTIIEKWPFRLKLKWSGRCTAGV
ncbi:hypothetical protein FACUT_3901 [Fusarium acutatum]|uniref:MYND-type domain-containing protein n=1 Tax=Fusarium acutatum TaxID=78861 RepID=A0A8H4JXC9_9HYPO|nr:hypothetical protein FACUT_3901 [Fusarium acutatum]